MTDDQLRDAAARALGWTPAGLGQWYVPMEGPKAVVLRDQAPPLDWITAGALLELCPNVEINGEFGPVAVTENDCGAMLCLHEWPDITARNVIEACVMALDTQSATP